ncbi:G protein-regulated inducer of neurite outgrowth 3 [Synchiropus splendidus]|uniref:G protein-regulated inducer of neurite outgrowth 3 n=1 Tax=Synchiropus splendidus TaxID=270530 RepID=UPI00237DF4A0|nr:G protein-regulated inducer of neurite outgrowth 3 [Synchiropus splendidus]
MGSNPKRTVTVQMVPQLTAVDSLGNKESNANWANESNRKLPQVCSDHTQASKTASQSQNAAPVGSEATARASNGNNGSADGKVQRSSVTADEPGGADTDSNANIRPLGLGENCDVSNSGVSEADTRSRNHTEANCSSKHNLNQAYDFKCADDKLNKEARSESEHLQSCPPGASQHEQKSAPSALISSSSPGAEKDVGTVNSLQASSDKRQLQMDSSASPQAVKDTATKCSQSAAVGEGQPLFREASTMTSSPCSATVKQCQDMEVQAVANMCSKSVCTSPSLMPAAHKPGPAAVPEEEAESLTIIHQLQDGAHFASPSAEPQSDKVTVKAEMCVKSALCNTQPVYQIDIQHSKDAGAEESAGNKTVEAPSAESGDAPRTTPEAAPVDGDKATVRSSEAAVATSGKNSTKDKTESKETNSDSDKQKEKSIHDVVWDEQGMTWEVYGASVDPESLGFAIQSHLQCKIKEQERKLIAQVSFRKSFSGATSPKNSKKSKRRHQNIFRSMFQNLRRPDCCARPPPSSVAD